MTSLGKNLKYYRELRNLSEEQLAIKARVGKKIIENYESGEQIPNNETIFRLSTVLDVPVTELTDRKS